MDEIKIEDSILNSIRVRLENPEWDTINENLWDTFERDPTQDELNFAYALHAKIEVAVSEEP